MNHEFAIRNGGSCFTFSSTGDEGSANVAPAGQSQKKHLRCSLVVFCIFLFSFAGVSKQKESGYLFTKRPKNSKTKICLYLFFISVNANCALFMFVFVWVCTKLKGR